MMSLRAISGWSGLVLALLAGCSGGALAAGGPIGIDHEVSFTATGIWSRNIQRDMTILVPLAGLGGAVWLGNDDRLGHALWQSMDASAIALTAGDAMKFAFRRSRPATGKGPDAWFQGSNQQSFPSGEVALQAAMVTPIIVNYAHDHPMVWALELLPAYDAEARVKSQAHWQSDVLFSWVMGSVTGYLVTRLDTPITVQVLPHGMTVGYSKNF